MSTSSSRGTLLVMGAQTISGSHACKALAAEGYDPGTYDDLSTGNRWAVRCGRSSTVTSWTPAGSTKS